MTKFFPCYAFAIIFSYTSIGFANNEGINSSAMYSVKNSKVVKQIIFSKVDESKVPIYQVKLDEQKIGENLRVTHLAKGTREEKIVATIDQAKQSFGKLSIRNAFQDKEIIDAILSAKWKIDYAGNVVENPTTEETQQYWDKEYEGDEAAIFTYNAVSSGSGSDFNGGIRIRCILNSSARTCTIWMFAIR